MTILTMPPSLDSSLTRHTSKYPRAATINYRLSSAVKCSERSFLQDKKLVWPYVSSEQDELT